jgi:hypothetical protein
MYYNPVPPNSDNEFLRLEAVTTCIGFDDLLDVTLTHNHPHLDTMIVVTSHDDIKTQQVAKKHGAILVLTDLFKKNHRNFNKGAAINAGFGHFQYHGWRMHLDSDIVLPDNFRRLAFNHTHLDKDALYGCDRIDVIGREHLHRLRQTPQHSWSVFMSPSGVVSPRYVDTLRGYIPIGYFQMWHADCQKPYPYSLGTAAHDDVLFADQWPSSHRRLLPTVVCYHLVSRTPELGENWNGKRRQPRLDEKK